MLHSMQCLAITTLTAPHLLLVVVVVGGGQQVAEDELRHLRPVWRPACKQHICSALSNECCCNGCVLTLHSMRHVACTKQCTVPHCCPSTHVDALLLVDLHGDARARVQHLDGALGLQRGIAAGNAGAVGAVGGKPRELICSMEQLGVVRTTALHAWSQDSMHGGSRSRRQLQGAAPTGSMSTRIVSMVGSRLRSGQPARWLQASAGWR